MTPTLTLLFLTALGGAILLALPSLPPLGRCFGVTVPPAFREREEARAALHQYYAYVLCGAGGAVGLTLALAGLGATALAAPVALLPLAAAIGYYRGRRRVLPYKTAQEAPDGFPLWGWLAFPPAAIPAAAMVYLCTHWSAIPRRYLASGWHTRTPLHVYGPPIFAEGLVLLLLFLGFAAYFGARKSPNRADTLGVLTIVTYPLALVFGAVSLMPVTHVPPWALAVALPPFILGFIVWVVLKNAEPKAEGQADTPEECWHTGDIYVNPADPAIFVEKRDGFGFTFNFGNPWGVRILVLFLAGIGALTAFLIWSQR